jgi:hypothetical protein
VHEGKGLLPYSTFDASKELDDEDHEYVKRELAL